LRFGGSPGIEIAIPTHVAVGPVSIETVYFIGKFNAGSIPVELSMAARGNLGPLQATVDRIGLTIETSFPAKGGNLGAVQIDLRFKPPNGVGLELTAGGFTGGRFLLLDPDKGEYAGGLELTFLGSISVRAVGILSTRLPDGSKGFSLLIILVSEFPPIQLSYGFTLVGIGGLLGLNRTVVVDDLQVGVRDGSLNSILFRPTSSQTLRG
jgi:hypothetical protein